jgi:capsular exopolysaccharide synthesis family protein
MSRNFELLQNLGKDFLQPTPVENPAPPAPGPVPVESAEPATPAITAIPAAIPAAATVAPVVMDQAGLEEVGGLVQQLFVAQGANVPRAIVFASTEAGSGCTWVCANVAKVLAASTAGSVCVVDANLRDPGLHTQFGVQNTGGLSESLRQLSPIRSYVMQLSRPNLFLISGGTSEDGEPAQIASDRMRLRVAELRQEFDFVLIDASAMSLGNDAIALSAMADGAVLVLKANTSRRELARKAVQDLQAGNAKVLGAVLNRRTFPIPNAIYKRL